MKNQIIKKIMAYLLVGAMVITTPMTASANELENAYSSTGASDGKNTRSGSGSSTNTQVIPAEIPEGIPEENKVDVVGIALDKDSLELKVGGEKGQIQARVLFDNYNPADEPMAWATEAVDYETKLQVETNVKWKIETTGVARMSNDSVNTKLVVEPRKRGTTKVTAWIDADKDGRMDDNEHRASATIKVIGDVQSVKFDGKETKFVEKRTYDLKKYTKLDYSLDGSDTGDLIGSGVNVVYSNLYTSDARILKKCKLSEDGTIKFSKGVPADTTFTFTMVADNGALGKGEFITTEPNPAKSISINGSNTVSLGDNKKELTATVTPEKSGVTTDEIIWTSSNKKIVEVTSADNEVHSDNKTTATITALAEGSAKITAKATSGKKSTFKIDVTADGVKVDILGAEKATYTGKDTYLNVVIKNKDGNMTFPASSIKSLKWSVDNKKAAKITGKKDMAILKPVNKLPEGVTDVNIVIKGKTLAETKQKIDLKQSNIEKIEVGARYDNIGIIIPKDQKKPNKTNLPVYVGMTYPYYAIAYNKNDDPDKEPAFSEAIGWSVSGSAVTIDSNGNITPVKAGSATVKASYVTLDDKGKAKLNSKSFKVKVTQNATAIAFAKAETVKNATGKVQTVSLKVKATEPKKATLNVDDWKVMAYIASSDTEGTEKGVDNILSTKKGTAGEFLSKNTKNSVKVTIPANAKPGSVIKVGAYTDGGAVAYAYIYVTEKTAKFDYKKKEGKKDSQVNVALGDINTTDAIASQFTVDKDQKRDAAIKGGFGTKGSTTSYVTEPVTYSLDKNAAKYIKVDQNGNITGLQITKKPVNLTVKTLSGKKKVLKVNVTAAN